MSVALRILLLAALLAAPGCELRRAWERRALNRTAEQAMAIARDDPDSAIRLADRVLDESPDHLIALYARATALHVADRLEEAVDAFGHATDVHPAFAEGHLFMGVCLDKLGREDEAASAYRSARDAYNERIAATQSPEARLDAHAHLALLTYLLGDRPAARERFDQLAEQYPDAMVVGALREFVESGDLDAFGVRSE